jgi:hypothetical protein
MFLILLNGPKQSGKTTIAKQLGDELDKSFRGRVIMAHLKQPLELMLRSFVATYYPEFSNLSYEQLKKTNLGGMSGRDIMISLGDSLRSKDASFLPRVLLKEINDSGANKPIVIVDDLGFEGEYAAFLHTPGATHISVYMEERGDRLYSHGQQFTNDNRQCLRGYADFIDPDVQTLASAVIDRLGE